MGIIDDHCVALMAIIFIQKRFKFIDDTVTIQYKNYIQGAA